MPQTNIFKWRPGNGWIMLSGGGDWMRPDVQQIEAAMLTQTHSQAPLAYLWAAGDVDTADHHMDALRDLGARTGYLVDIMTEEDDVLYQQLSEAGVIILGDGPNQRELRMALVGIGMRGLEEAFFQGATIYAPGASASLLGAHVVEDGKLVPGFGWLASSLVVPGYTPEQADAMHEWVRHLPDGFGLGLGSGAGVGFGPSGEVAVMGNGAVTVSLGQRYDPGLHLAEEG